MQKNNNLQIRRKYFKFNQSDYNSTNHKFSIIFQPITNFILFFSKLGKNIFKFDQSDYNFNVY